MRLERLGHSARDARRIEQALAIYRDAIIPEARNPEREILYWIDHGRSMAAGELSCLAIEDDDVVVGYLQYSYFDRPASAFIEYVCLSPSSRLGGVDLMSAIVGRVTEEKPAWRAIVGELAFKNEASTRWREDRALQKLAGRFGFGRLAIPYRYPALNSLSREASHPADLVARLRTGDRIPAKDALEIVRAIYFDHYLGWDAPFLSPARLNQRRELIGDLFDQQAAALGKLDSVLIEPL